VLGGLGVATVLLALMAPPAGAHAAFVSSEPEPGSRQTSTPGVVVLRFSEPLIAKLSGASVAAPGGQRFQARGTAGSEIRVPVATNAPGVYTVEWRTVSPVDGHTLRGRFLFGVGVDPGGGAEGETGGGAGGGWTCSSPWSGAWSMPPCCSPSGSWSSGRGPPVPLR
jgi:Uncharacterized protein, homolog of Cu resistance protein CopC